MLEVAWLVFKDRHLNNQQAKKYLDWPMTFANSVKGCWYHLWHVNEEGHRQGRTGEIALRFDGTTQRWVESSESLAAKGPPARKYTDDL